MKIVFLYAEVISYTEGMIRALRELKQNIEIHIVSKDKDKLSHYQMEETGSVKYYPRSSMNTSELYDFLCIVKPDLVYNSGWSDVGYRKSTRKYKARHKEVKVVVGLDNQWSGTWRQKTGVLIYGRTLRGYIDFMWVAGKAQYHFARRIGFSNTQIISNLYSANTFLFNKQASFVNRFVYLGRFAPEKNILALVQAYRELPIHMKKRWPLVLIGDGPLFNEIESLSDDNIILKGFMQSEALRDEIMKGGVFISPSTFEPWGVTIHEMALLGYPMIVSNVCGAASEFLIDGYNGYLFDPQNRDALAEKLLKIINCDIEKLTKFCSRSHSLGKRINSYIAAASLLSVIDND